MAFSVHYRETKDDRGDTGWAYLIVEDGGYQYPGSGSRTFATKEDAAAEAESALIALERLREILRND